jgi:hypothetical protein
MRLKASSLFCSQVSDASHANFPAELNINPPPAIAAPSTFKLYGYETRLKEKVVECGKRAEVPDN